MIYILINYILLLIILLLTTELLSVKNTDNNKYRIYVKKINHYSTFGLIKYNNKYYIYLMLIFYLLLRAFIIYLFNEIYNNEFIGWHIRFYYLTKDNKLLSPLPFINAFSVSIISYMTFLLKIIIILALLYFKKRILIKVSLFFKYIFEVIEPIYEYLRKGYYGGLKYHTSIILIILSSILYYFIWIIFSYKLKINSFLNGIILFFSLLNNMILWYSICLFIVFLLFGFGFIKNKKLVIVLYIFYIPVKLKMEKYFTFGKYKFNIGLLLTAVILFFSTYLLKIILIKNLFMQYNFSIL